MSRKGKRPINIPAQVKVKLEGPKVFVEGPKGKLEWDAPNNIGIKIEDSKVVVEKLKEDRLTNASHGLARSYIDNMITGVNSGYVKNLEIQGVGYRAQVQGKNLILQLGFSHPVDYLIPEGITVKTPKPNLISIEGVDKAKVGEVAAEIRDFLKPEPYKGKGIRYEGEYVRKKAGKAVVK